eukprot:SAG31_NODE_1558_length_7885_cov_2.567300_5_plen_58_part_00
MISERQEAVAFLLDPTYLDLRNLLHDSVKNMKDTERLMTRIQVTPFIACHCQSGFAF